MLNNEEKQCVYFRVSENKLDKTFFSSKLEVDGYVIRLDQSRRGYSVAWFVKRPSSNSCEDSFCINTGIIFLNIYLPKSKPIPLGVLYRPLSESDFVKHINGV